MFLYSRSLLLIYFVHISVYMSIPTSQFILPPLPPHHHHFPPLVSIRLFSTSVSLFLPCKLVHLYHFSRFHIYKLIYGICFSLSDLLHSVWQSLGPFTSLRMTQFHSFLWLSNIPLYIYPEKTIIQKDTCTPMFTAALFTIARSWKQPNCPTTDEWIKKMWYVYTPVHLYSFMHQTFSAPTLY